MTRPQPEPLTASTILVVEDDADTREFYEVLLLSEGYRVLTADSGHTALAHIAAQPVSGVLLDRRLPDMDGVQLCRHLRERVAAAIPIIFITADHDSALAAAARAAGATDFLSKPFRLDALLEGLAAHIQS